LAYMMLKAVGVTCSGPTHVRETSQQFSGRSRVLHTRVGRILEYVLPGL